MKRAYACTIRALGDPKVWMKPVPDFINACHAVQSKPCRRTLNRIDIGSQWVVDQLFQHNCVDVGRH